MTDNTITNINFIPLPNLISKMTTETSEYFLDTEKCSNNIRINTDETEKYVFTTTNFNPPSLKMPEKTNNSSKGSLNIANQLANTYNLYYHLPNDNNWDISSYKIIKSFSTIEELVSLNENLPKNIIKYCMLFAMKDGIAPMWEDPRNKNGGCFSYKVYNKYVVEIWKQMVYAFCGESLMVNKENMKYITGITISPKKNFCILKIWIENIKLQNPEEVIPIENLSKMGVLFKAHT
jgi:hypothetical protein